MDLFPLMSRRGPEQEEAVEYDAEQHAEAQARTARAREVPPPPPPFSPAPCNIHPRTQFTPMPYRSLRSLLTHVAPRMARVLWFP